MKRRTKGRNKTDMRRNVHIEIQRNDGNRKNDLKE
jgi:hypothetical protein